MENWAVFRTRVWVCTVAVVLLATVPAHGQDLVGIDFDTSNAYRISTSTGQSTLIGNTGVPFLGALDRALDGNYYGTTVVADELFRFNPTTFVGTRIAALSRDIFEGGLAQSPGGTVYATNGGSATAAQLLTIDLSNGQMSLVGTISGGSRDINGIVWRADGKLVGMDRVSNSLLVIDPLTANASVLARLTPTVGALGGMTLVGDTGYLVTAGPTASNPGSNELWSFDPFTGLHQRVAGLGPTISGSGIGGLATLVPEPVGILSVMALWPLLRRPRRALDSTN
jgi:hypothetical protein